MLLKINKKIKSFLFILVISQLNLYATVPHSVLEEIEQSERQDKKNMMKDWTIRENQNQNDRFSSDNLSKRAEMVGLSMGEIKSKIFDKIDKRISNLEKSRKCVEDAQNKEELRYCKPKRKSGNREQRDMRRLKHDRENFNNNSLR